MRDSALGVCADDFCAISVIFSTEFNRKVFMAYTEKFQQLADGARQRVTEVSPLDVDTLVAAGAIALDIRDKDEHDVDLNRPGFCRE